jgi:hypothetical protein
MRKTFEEFEYVFVERDLPYPTTRAHQAMYDSDPAFKIWLAKVRAYNTLYPEPREIDDTPAGWVAVEGNLCSVPQVAGEPHEAWAKRKAEYQATREPGEPYEVWALRQRKPGPKPDGPDSSSPEK